MAFQPQFEPGEVVEKEVSLAVSNKILFLLLTNNAVYWPGKKKFAVSDPITTERLSFREIERVQIGRKSATLSLLVGLVMVVGGTLWTLAGFFGAPQALIVGGIVIAIIGGRRRTLKIQGAGKTYKWSEPVHFGGQLGKTITAHLDSVAKWAADHGIRQE